MPCMSRSQIKRTVPGAVRQTVRRTVCRLVAVSSEDRLKEPSAGPCHKCLRMSKSRSILLIPDDHRVDGPIRNWGQSACLFIHLLSTILEPTFWRTVLQKNRFRGQNYLRKQLRHGVQSADCTESDCTKTPRVR